jgi:hypothetical protein
MLKDDFERLLKLFHEGAEGKLLDLAEVFSQSLEFFNHLKTQIENGTPEEKQEAIRMMGELYSQMMLATKQITEKSGLSEEQLLSYADDPSNFTPEQWAAIQESRQQITKAGEDIAKAVTSISKKPPEKDGKQGWLRP